MGQKCCVQLLYRPGEASSTDPNTGKEKLPLQNWAWAAGFRGGSPPRWGRGSGCGRKEMVKDGTQDVGS